MGKIPGWVKVGGVIAGLFLASHFYDDWRAGKYGRGESRSERRPRTLAEIDSKQTEDLSAYFPLTVGNTWTYRRIVFHPEKVCNYSSKTISKSTGFNNSGWNTKVGATYSVFGLSLGDLKEGKEKDSIEKIVSEEKYTIVSGPDKRKFYQVRIDGKNVRDGRYSEVNNTNKFVRWGYKEDMPSIFEEVDSTYLDCDAVGLTLSVLMEKGTFLSTGRNETYIIGATDEGKNVSVPAGNFSDCLMNHIMINSTNAHKHLSGKKPAEFIPGDKEFAFETHSYYAEDVGLVKEEQFNPDGEKTYQLELVRYKVK